MGNHKVIKTACGNSRYSMYDFISEVKAMPILWNRDHDEFHSRELRDKAWQIVGKKLCKTDNEDEEELNEMAKTLQKRWKNTRDSFLRTIRLRQSGLERSRPSYIYEKELSFLLDSHSRDELTADMKVSPAKLHEKRQIKNETTNGSTPEEKTQRTRAAVSKAASKSTAASAIVGSGNKRVLHGVAADAKNSKLSIKKRRYDFEADNDNIETKTDDDDDDVGNSYNDGNGLVSNNDFYETSSIHEPVNEEPIPETATLTMMTSNVRKLETSISSLDHHNATTTMSTIGNSTISVVPTDPDQAFFESIKPHMQHMNNEQKLDFQIEVLQLLRKFKTN